jgi:hypothetical protein
VARLSYFLLLSVYVEMDNLTPGRALRWNVKDYRSGRLGSVMW